MTLFIQVYDENDVCRFDGVVTGVPKDVFNPSGDPSGAVTYAGVKTALDYHLFQEREKAKQ